ncbi:hypothetical protein C8J56DRAFT_334850 [Mycena floridula]|nr:hypothetical protein C8J56DRAFT_334850 [Mycena floridula]
MSLSEAQTYSSSLLPKRHGYPLWLPEPHGNLPTEYRRNGLRIGDVVILTEDGGFDYMFNIFADETESINQGRTPHGFNPLALDEQDVLYWENRHKPGASISTMNVKKLELNSEAAMTVIPGIPSEFGAGFEFKSSSTSGGTLVLPDGASRIEYRNHSRLEEYITRNIHLWFEHVNGPRGRDTRNLCLVTGCDKSKSWGAASFSTFDSTKEISLKFVAASLGAGFSYTWNTVSPAAVRVSAAPGQFENQCVFLRGFNLTQRPSRFGSRTRVTISDVSTIMWKPRIWNRMGLRSSEKTIQSPPTEAVTSSNHSHSQSVMLEQDLSDNSDTESLNDDDQSFDSGRPFHPGESINESILANVCDLLHLFSCSFTCI